jgi:hypothetical protein
MTGAGCWREILFGTCSGVLGLAALLSLATGCASTPRVAGPADPELKHLSLWTGQWTFRGTAKGSPTKPEYKLVGRFNGRWVLNGHFLETRETMKGDGPEIQSFMMTSYDPVSKADVIHRFMSDGSTEVIAATWVNDHTIVGDGTYTGPDGNQKFRITWVVSPDQKSISEKSEAERDGVKWTGFTGECTRTAA